MTQQDPKPGQMWHSPNYDRFVIVRNLDFSEDVHTITYSNIAGDTRYETSISGFMERFKCQSPLQL